MPYRIEKIDPLDLDENKVIGVKLPFSSNSVFTPTYQTIDAYRSNLLNYFLTSKGERYFNLGFGNRLVEHLFEPSVEDTISTLDAQIRDDIAYFFPKLIIESLDILRSDTEECTLQVHIRFRIKNSEKRDELTINFE